MDVHSVWFRLVITFLPRSKRLLISWLQSPSAVILEPEKIKSDTVSTVSPSISHEVISPHPLLRRAEGGDVLRNSPRGCSDLKVQEKMALISRWRRDLVGFLELQRQCGVS